MTSVQFNIGADGKLADAVAVFVGVGVGPEILLQRLVLAEDLGDAIVLHADGQRLALEIAVFVAEIIADHAVDYVHAVHFARRGEDFAAGQIAPLVAADDAAGLDPAIVRVERAGEVAAGGGFAGDLFRAC